MFKSNYLDTIKVDFYSTTKKGGAGAAAYRIYKSLLIQKKRFFSKSSFEVRDIVSLSHSESNSFVQKVINSIRARIFFRKKKRVLQGKPKGIEQFSGASNFYKTYPAVSDDKTIIHLHSIPDWLDYSSFFSSIPSNQPIVWTLHDMNPFTGGCHYAWGCNGYKNLCKNCFQLGPKQGTYAIYSQMLKINSLINKNIHVVSNSNWMMNVAKESAVFRSAKSFRVINCGIDFSIFKPTLLNYFKGLSSTKYTICFGPGALGNKRKGVDEFFEMLKILKKKSVDIRCLIFGVIDDNFNVADSPETIFLGKQNQPQLAEIYSMSDLFIMPSLEEAFGLTAVEAMACQTPVLAFKTGGITDSVVEGETGWLVPKGDVNALANKIIELMDQPELVRSIGVKAREYVCNKFSMEDEAEAYMKLYKEISV